MVPLPNILFIHPMYFLSFFVLVYTLEAASGYSSLRTLVGFQSVEGQEEREVRSICPLCSLSFSVVMAATIYK